MKNKNTYGFLFLVLIIMLLPIGLVSAKYKQTKDVGTITLDIAPSILSPSWKKQLSTTCTRLIVDSFKPEENPNEYINTGLNWEEGKSIGYIPDSSDKGQVRLFEKNGTAYILAQGKKPVIFPEDSSFLFAGWDGTNNTNTNLTNQIIFKNIDTSNVTNMMGMFSRCSNLTELDLSSFNTSNVVNMSNLFSYCISLTSLDVRSFITSKVTNMNSMFAYCIYLTNIEFDDTFNTLNVTDMANMFYSCMSLRTLDVSKFNTASVKDMNSMFDNCSGLENITLGNNFDTSEVTNMASMFRGCEKLKSLNLGTKFKNLKVENMTHIFDGCKSLETLDLDKFNTSEVTDMSYMFKDCKALTSLDLNKFDTSKVTTSIFMFDGCSALTSLDLSSFDTSKLTASRYMFNGCGNLIELNLSSFNTSNVVNMQNMFSKCSNLKTIYVGDYWKTDKLQTGQSYQEMFLDCFSLVGGNGTNYNRSHIGKDYARIDTQDTPGYLTSITEKPSTTSSIFSLVQEGGTIIGTQTTNSEEELQ